MSPNALLKHFDQISEAPDAIPHLRRFILDLAVRGKLVPQDSTDEHASKLLKKIASEKKHLMAEGTLQKSKHLPPIKPEEIPYNLPKGWEWVRLGELGQTQTGTTPSKAKPEYFGPGYPFVKPGDISKHKVAYDGEQLTVEGIRAGRLIQAGSALMVCIGGSIGKVGYVDRHCSCNQQINALTPYGGIDGHFVVYWMKSSSLQQQVLLQAPQTTMPILSKSKWESLLFPLPPLAEQHRIVAKVDELMSLCDELEAEIKNTAIFRRQLLEATLYEALFGQFEV
jgi:type I restriction enzyme, S subunit